MTELSVFARINFPGSKYMYHPVSHPAQPSQSVTFPTLVQPTVHEPSRYQTWFRCSVATYVCVLRVWTLCLSSACVLVTTQKCQSDLPDSPPRHPSEENLVHPRVTHFYPQTTHQLPLPCIQPVVLELATHASDLSYPYRRCSTVLIHPIIILHMFTHMYMYDRPGVWGEFSQIISNEYQLVWGSARGCLPPENWVGDWDRPSRKFPKIRRKKSTFTGTDHGQDEGVWPSVGGESCAPE